MLRKCLKIHKIESLRGVSTFMQVCHTHSLSHALRLGFVLSLTTLMVILSSATFAGALPQTLLLPKSSDGINHTTLDKTDKKKINQQLIPSTPSINAPVKAIVYAGQNTPRQLQTVYRPKASLYKSLNNEDTLKHAAQEFLDAYKNLLHITNPKDELALQGIRHDALGRHYLNYVQTYQGIPIWPTELTVQINKAGQIDLLNGYYIPSPHNIILTPQIEQTAAIEAAQAAINDITVSKEIRLIIHAPQGSPPRLAWQVDFAPSLTTRWQVFIDALQGGVLKKLNHVNFAASTGSGYDATTPTPINRPLNLWNIADTFYMVDTSKTAMFIPPTLSPTTFNELRSLQGAIIIEDAQGRTSLDTAPVTSNDANNWTNANAVSAAYGLSEAYDYFFTRHDVEHLVGANESIKAIVNFGTNYNGSFWQPDLKLIVLGNAQNYAASLDIIAHELSHALVNKTARLIYENQSGALNEAFADIFGEAAEASSFGSTDWLMGSQLSQPTRNLANPAAINIPTTTRPYPANMTQYIKADDSFLDSFANRDFGGVHFNSTIISHAFYILASSIGLFDAEKIFYHTLAFQLTRYSQFIDARLGAIVSAEKIFGTNSTQALATANAFTSVGIFEGDPTQPVSPTPQVNNSDSTLFITNSNNLNRQESNDLITPEPAISTRLSRPSVSGDGTLAAYIDTSNNVCTISTLDLTSPNCLNPSVQAHSVALSPNKKKLAYVLTATPSVITIFDLLENTTDTLNITAPTTDNNVLLATIKNVDQLDFSGDSRTIYFNAFNEITYLDNNTTSSWSIYTVNITDQQIRSVVPPIKGIDFGYPSLGNTQDNLLTFTGFDAASNTTYIFAADLDLGIAKQLVGINTIDAAPSFNGNDSAIIYTNAGNLYRQNVSTVDHVTASGNATLWQANARFGVIYRRGTFLGPNLPPEGSIDDLSIEGETVIASDGIYDIKLNDRVLFKASAIDKDSEGAELVNPEIHYEWHIYDNAGKVVGNALGQTPTIPFTTRGDFIVRLTATDNFGASDPTPASVGVRVGGNNIPPIATITTPTTSEVTIAVGQTLAFKGSGTDADGTIPEGQTTPPLTYSWIFSGIDENGDPIVDVPPPSTDKDPNDITFSVAGIYTVNLTVTDAAGDNSLNTAQVTIRVETNPNNQAILNDSAPPGGGGRLDMYLFLLILLIILRSVRLSSQNDRQIDQALLKTDKTLAQACPSP